MQEFVTDTMALIRRIEQRPLGVRAKKIFEEAEAQESMIYVPAIALGEILYLGEKSSISISLSIAIEYIRR
jgi:predicted nucleic acid-binding protein